jgi:trans-aconitate methyltransferase
MTQGWHDIWNRRIFPEDQPIDLQNLVHLDGFDSGAGQIDASDWRHYAATIVRQFSLSNDSSVYEVGCGAGALLYGLVERVDIDVGGCDFSSPLISVARRAISKGDFTVSDATPFPVRPPYDVVLANAVFHYFPDFEYAFRVLERMTAKARRAVAILDVPDEAMREMSELKRRDMLSPKEYDRKYSGLDHLYFSKSWFRNMSEALSMKCNFLDIKIPNYAQSSFRFGVMLSKES